MFGNKNSVAVETANAVIMSAAQTNMYLNQLPLVKMVIGIFPDNGPMEIVECKQALSFVDIPMMVPGASVSVIFERDKKGTIKKLDNIKLNHIEWEGDSEVVDAVKALIERMKDCKLIQAEGETLSIEETQAKISGVPIFRYHIRFNTQEGQSIEGDTYQAARPWLQQYRKEHPMVMIQYSAVRSEDFGLARQ